MAAEQDTVRLEQDLQDDLFVAYVYIGGEDDEGWRVARVATGLLVQLNIYRFDDHTLLKKWIGTKRPRAIVFGWSDKVHALLDKTQADDLETVVTTIQQAQEQHA